MNASDTNRALKPLTRVVKNADFGFMFSDFDTTEHSIASSALEEDLNPQKSCVLQKYDAGHDQQVPGYTADSM